MRRLPNAIQKLLVITIVLPTIVGGLWQVYRSQAATGVPRMISYQGKLTTPAGALVTNGAYNMAFVFYDALTSGNCLWGAKGTGVTGCTVPSTTMAVTITNGEFSVLLGDTSSGGGSQNALPATLFDDDSRYLEVQISGETLSPRRRIGAAGYAVNTDRLDGLETSSTGGTSAVVPVTSSSGNFTLTGTPAGTGVSQGVMYINPASATANFALFGIAVNGTSKFKIDAEGDTTIGGTLNGLTLPSSGTLVTLAGTETLTNKTLTSPVLTTPTLGVATATTLNKLTITAPATGSTLTIADGKIFTASNTLTLTATDGSTLAIGAGGTLGTGAYATIASYAPLASPTFTGTVTIPTPFTLGATSVTSTGTQLNYLASAGGTTGTTSTNVVFSTSPTLVTPTLGVASATSINKVAITTPATSATLTITDGKTLSASNSLTLAGTDSTTITFQGTDTYVGRATTDTLTNKTLTTPVITSISNSGTITIPTGTDTLVARATTDTLTNKTLTSPDINGGTADALTSLGIRSTGTGAFDLSFANTENLTAARALTLKVNNAARTVDLGGDFTLAGAFSTSGANALTLTTTGATNVTLPTTGTLATLAGSEALTNKTISSSSGAFTTLSSTGVTALGNDTATVAIDSSDWNIDTTGAMTGIGAITSNGAISTTPSSNVAALTLQGTNLTTANLLTVNARNTSGTLVSIAYDTAKTLSTNGITGLAVDLNTNLTGANGLAASGLIVSMPPLTQTNDPGSPTYYTALNLNTNGALIQNTAAGTIAWSGLDVITPNITQTTGTVTATGSVVVTGSITTGGTQTGYAVAASGVAAGTLLGVDIQAITAGNGTETALAIGSGWDDAININSGALVAETSGALAIAPNTTGTFLDFALETEWTQGTLINADFASATTQSGGDIVGLKLDFDTNLTGAADLDITGTNVVMNALTAADSAVTTIYTGYNISAAGALSVTDGVNAAVVNWRGVNLTMPVITQNTGDTVTADGLRVLVPASGAIVTGGTMSGINVVAPTTSGPAAGTLYGVQIGALTSAGGATETALSIGTGWDTGLSSASPISTTSTLNVDSTVTLGGTTIDANANFALASGTGTFVQTYTGDTTDAHQITANSVSTADALQITANGLTTGNGINLSSTSTAGGVSGSSYLLKIVRSGANSNTAHTAYGVYSDVTNTNATSGTNIAGYFTASGATTANYALFADGTQADIVGSSASGGDLLLVSTSDATKGDIQFHSSSYIINSSGQMTVATDESINGIDINGGAVADVTTLGMSGDFTQTGSTAFSTGTGAISLNGDTTVAANKSLTFSSGTGSLIMTNSVNNASDKVVDITPAFAGGATDTLTYTVIDIAAFTPTNAAGTDTIQGLSIGALTQGADAARLTANAINIGDGWDKGISGATYTIDGTTALTIGTSTGTIAIDSSDWDIDTTGAMTGIGAITSNGLITGSAGATLTGATISLNASSNFGVNIGTGSSNGAVAIGGNSNTVAINSSDWDITTGGAMSGIGSIAADGALTISPTTTGTFLDFALETEWTTGTLINADFASATTQTGAITGMAFNLDTNLTLNSGSSTVTGISLTIPGAPAGSGAGTKTLTGINISTLMSGDSAGETVNSRGVNISIGGGSPLTPDGAVNADGLRIDNAFSDGSAGDTINLINLVPAGVQGGTYNGLNIDGIIANGATETAIKIGSGWDDAININSGALIAEADGSLSMTQVVSTTGSPKVLNIAGGAHTTLTASTEAADVNLNLARTVQFATGALTNQRAFKVLAPTYGFVGASTLTNAATFYIDNAPQAGTNATITNAYALWVDDGAARFDGNIAQSGTGTFGTGTGAVSLNGVTTVAADKNFILASGTGKASINAGTEKLSALTVKPGADVTNIGGTTTANATTTITGSGTTFLTSLGIGDRISLSSASTTYATVTTITSNTELTVDTALGADASQKTINVKKSIFRLDNSAGTPFLLINDLGQLGAGTLVPSTEFHLVGSYGGNRIILGVLNDPAYTGSGTMDTEGILLWTGGTHNDEDTAAEGTNPIAVVAGFQQSTLSATNASVTTTNAATVYIANAPAAGTNMTITNKYSLWAAAGTARLGGDVITGDGTTTTTKTAPFFYLGTTAGAPTGVPLPTGFVSAPSGVVALDYDTTNNKLCAYNAAWKCTAALADVAEWVPAAGTESGDIIMTTATPNPTVDPTAPTMFAKTATPYSNQMAGVISQYAEEANAANGYKLSADYHAMAIAGRVPVKVNLEGGDIVPGDRITSSSVPGVGMKAKNSGWSIGIALQSYDASSTDNKIVLYIDPQYAIVDSQLAFDADGNVGIGVADAQYKLHVAGDVAATSFVNISTKAAKKDIEYLTAEDNRSILTKLASVNVARYHYNEESATTPLHLGLIAEEAPLEVLSASGKGVDIYKLASFTLAAVKAQQSEIEQIKEKLEQLDNKLSAIGGVSGASTTDLEILRTEINLLKHQIEDLSNVQQPQRSAPAPVQPTSPPPAPVEEPKSAEPIISIKEIVEEAPVPTAEPTTVSVEPTPEPLVEESAPVPTPAPTPAPTPTPTEPVAQE